MSVEDETQARHLNSVEHGLRCDQFLEVHESSGLSSSGGNKVRLVSVTNPNFLDLPAIKEESVNLEKDVEFLSCDFPHCSSCGMEMSMEDQYMAMSTVTAEKKPTKMKKMADKLGLSWAKLSPSWGLKLEFEAEV